MKTTITIDKETRLKLCGFGKKGETYDDIIKKLMKYYETGNNLNL